MKVKLILLPRLSSQSIFPMLPPVGIAHLQAFLKSKNIETDIDDLDIKIISNNKIFSMVKQLENKLSKSAQQEHDTEINNTLDRILEMINFKNYDIIGFSISEDYTNILGELLAKKIKEKTNALIIFGGAGITNEKKSFNDNLYINGSGEQPILDIINKLENKPREIVEWPHAFPRFTPNFDGLPLHLYRNSHNNLQYENPGKILILPTMWSLGCNYRCSFCNHSLIPKAIFHKSAREIVDELEILSIKYKTKYFFVLSNHIYIIPPIIKQVCDDIIKRKLNIIWSASARINIDLDILPLLHTAGCRYLAFGLESGSNKILELMKKGYNSERAAKTLKQTFLAGIKTKVNIIIGFPGETEANFQETMDFLTKNKQYIYSMNISIFTFCYSEIFMKPEKYGIRPRFRNGEKTNEYDEINGYQWEELENIKILRFKKLKTFFDVKDDSMHKILAGN